MFSGMARIMILEIYLRVNGRQNVVIEAIINLEVLILDIGVKVTLLICGVCEKLHKV